MNDSTECMRRSETVENYCGRPSGTSVTIQHGVAATWRWILGQQRVSEAEQWRRLGISLGSARKGRCEPDNADDPLAA